MRQVARENGLVQAGQNHIADRETIARDLMKHAVEEVIVKVTGAGGAGADIENVPFEPAEIIALNPAGATPAVHNSVFATSGAIHMTTAAAAAANANPPTLTKVGDYDWTVGIPTQMAPDGEELTIILRSVRAVGISE